MNIASFCPWWCMLLAAVFLIAWLIQIVLLAVVWLRPLRYSIRQRKSQQLVGSVSGIEAASGSKPGVSIIVYTHNQGEALVRNLPVLLSQDYPTFEVIIIDDTSKDDTPDVLAMMDQRYDRLFHTRIDEKVRTMSHRKLAVLLGIKAAHYELVVLTQAQCLPSSDQWLLRMVQHFQEPSTEVVIGPVVLERRSSFLSRFAQYDLFHRMVRMFGLTLAVRPFSGWGQNMAFRKSVFYANRSQGYQRHLNIQPGEDDLFVTDVAHGSNVAVECQPESVMTNQLSPMFSAWGLDRLNRGFTSRLYAFPPMLMQVLDALTRYLTVLPGFALVGWGLYTALQGDGQQTFGWGVFASVFACLLLRVVLMVYAEAALAKRLHVRQFIIWPLFMDLYLPLVDLWYRIKALIYKKSFGVGYIGLK